MPNNTPLFTLTPNFVSLYVILFNVRVALIGAALSVPLGSMIAMSLGRSSTPTLGFYATVALVLTLVLIIGYYLWTFFTYKVTRYEVYEDKMLFYEGFLNIQEKEIHYSRISEVELSRNILQRFFGLGTIKILTPATIASTHRQGSGIKMVDLDIPQESFKKVKDIIHAFEKKAGDST